MGDDGLRDRVAYLRRNSYPLLNDAHYPRMHRVRQIKLTQIDANTTHVDMLGYALGDYVVSIVLSESSSLLDLALNFDEFCYRRFCDPLIRRIVKASEDRVWNAVLAGASITIRMPTEAEALHE